MLRAHIQRVQSALQPAIPLGATAMVFCASGRPQQHQALPGGDDRSPGSGAEAPLGRFPGRASALLRGAARAAVWFDQNIIDGGIHALGAAGGRLARAMVALDDHVVDGVPRFLAGSVQLLGLFARQIQTGSVQWYVLCATAAAIVMFFLFR